MRHAAPSFVLAIILAIGSSSCATTPGRGNPSADARKAPEAAQPADPAGAASGATSDAAEAAVLITLGDSAMTQGNADLALYQYVQSLERLPNNPQALVRIGQIHEFKGNFDVALKAYRDALDASGTNVSADLLESIGLLQLRLDQLDEASATMMRTLEMDANRWQAVNALGVISGREGEPVKAITHFDRALALSPNNPMILNNRGNAKYGAGIYRDAEVDLRMAAALGVREAWVTLGRVQAAGKNYSAAMESFLKAMEVSRAYNECGKAAERNGDLIRARDYFEQARTSAGSYYTEAEKNLAAVNERLRQAESSGR